MKKYAVQNRVYLCPLMLVQSMIMSKWKGRIIWALLRHEVLRYGELRSGINQLEKISDKMLIESLKELELDGIVNRKSFDVLPPKVEYSLTKQGQKLQPVWQMLWDFGATYKI